MESNENPLAHQLVHKFGDEDSSDVTFVIGTEEFKCHKEILSVNSSYFKAMFSSEFKEKDQARIIIQEDPAVFKTLLDVLYKGWMSVQEELTCCQQKPEPGLKGCRREPSFSYCASSELWLRCLTLLQVFDKYDVDQKIVKELESFIKKKNSGTHRSCACDGIKLLLCMFCFVNKAKELSRDEVLLMAEAIPVIKKIHPDLRFDADHLEWVLNQNPPSKEKGSSAVEPEEPDTSDVKQMIRIFGDEELSDVTFVVRGEEFKCHKMFLAARSAHFQEMFFPTSTKISPDIVHLDEDPVVFSQLMSILYFGNFLEYRAIINCYKRGKATDKLPCPVIPKLWKAYSSLIKLADKLGVRDHVIAAFDSCFMCSWQADHRRPYCTCIGAKFIFAAIYGLHEYTGNVIVASREIGAGAFSVIKKLEPDLTFDLDTFQLLLARL